MSYWKPGDIAIIIDDATCKANPELAIYRGATVTLDFLDIPYFWWVSATANGATFRAREDALRKPYDGNELVEWSSCAFQPKELVVTT